LTSSAEMTGNDNDSNKNEIQANMTIIV
jgi:hypothetical protein